MTNLSLLLVSCTTSVRNTTTTQKELDYTTLLQGLEHLVGNKGTELQWFETYLSSRLHFVHVIWESFSYTKVNIGIPQDTMLEPTIFIYMLPLGSIIRSQIIHFDCYADGIKP